MYPLTTLIKSITALLLLLPLTASQATTTITEGPAAPSTVPDYTSLPQFTSAILSSSNFYRSEHSAVNLTWNSSLADYATNYLSTDNCYFAHSGGPDGENIAEGYPNATAAVQAWGNERAIYDFNNPGFSEATGHFTQLVWKATLTVGCGATYCGDTQGWYVVCEYWPRGNVLGSFGENVGKQVSGTVTAAATTGAGAAPTTTCIQGGVCNGAMAIEPGLGRTWIAALWLGVCVGLGILI